MADDTAASEDPIDGKASLVEYLEAGCKPEKDWRIGTEHEKFAYHLTDLSPLVYEGRQARPDRTRRRVRYGRA